MGNRRYFVYLSIFLLVALNYVDRVALSIAAPSIAKEYNFDPVQMGYLFSSYIWTYLLCLIPFGFLTDKYGARRINSIGAAIWSGATMLTGLASSFFGLLSARLVMGAAEASTYPAGGRALRDWSPRSEFGLAATMLNSGGYAGPAIGTLLLGWVVSITNWRWSFYVAGGICFLWLLAWLAWYGKPEDANFIGEDERRLILRERSTSTETSANFTGFARLLRSRTMLVVAITQGCAVYTQIVFLTWLPSYLINVKQLSIMKSGLFTALPNFIATALAWVLAHMSDRWLTAKGGGTTGQRRLVVVLAMLSAAVVLLAPLVDNIGLILALITVSLTGLATGISLNIALASAPAVSAGLRESDGNPGEQRKHLRDHRAHHNRIHDFLDGWIRSGLHYRRSAARRGRVSDLHALRCLRTSRNERADIGT
jgi:MFS family permease